jgi:hypothetical protein
MQLDLTAELQPALWGLLIGLLVAALALVAAADRDELDLLWRNRNWRSEWRRRLRLVRALSDQLLGRVTVLATRMSQFAPHKRRKA